MDTCPPLISIVIATCNRPSLARRAIESVLMQDYLNLEVIVVNNGTKPELLSDYEMLLDDLKPSINYIDLNNELAIGIGPSAARNAGIRAAKGDYIGFLDDDDCWIEPNYLSNIAPVLADREPDIIFANQAAVTISEKTQITIKSVEKKTWFCSCLLTEYSSRISENIYELEPSYFYDNGGFPHLNITLYKRCLIEAKGGFDHKLSYEEDFEFFLRMLISANDIIYYDKVVSHHTLPLERYNQHLSQLVSGIDKYSNRLSIFISLLPLTGNAGQLDYLTKSSCYTLKSIAEIYLESGQWNLAKVFAKQAIAWDSSFKKLIWFGLIIFNQRALVNRLSSKKKQ